MTDSTPPELLFLSLRGAHPAKQADYLRLALNTPSQNVEEITDTLLLDVAEGRLPPAVIRTWLGVSRSPVAAARAFSQNNSVYTRDIAIKQIGKFMRKKEEMESTWKALGGADGLCRQMAKLSINQLRSLCDVLGDLQKSGDAQPKELRRKLTTELFDHLTDPIKNTDEGRPVMPIYARLLPACNAERAQSYVEKLEAEGKGVCLRAREEKKLAETDWAGFEQRAFRQTFGADGKRLDLRRLKIFIEEDQKFALRVLEAVVDREDCEIPDAERFMSDLALPMASRLPTTQRPNPHVEAHSQFWKHINILLERHANLRTALEHTARWPGFGDCRPSPTLLECAVKSWGYCRGSLDSSENLTKVLSFSPSEFFQWRQAENLLDQIEPQMRYGLLRIWLATSPTHRLDIGEKDDERKTTLRGIQLPMKVFVSLGAADSLVLFERCLDANPDHSFLLQSINMVPSILRQKHNLHDPSPDPQIFRAFLIQRADPGTIILPKDPGSVIQGLSTDELERRKKLAKEGKEPYQRAFWALSALRLCAALRDSRLMLDTLSWARRFNRDPLAVQDIYPWFDVTPFWAYGTMFAEENVSASEDELRRRVLCGNGATVHLLETVLLVQKERFATKKHSWDSKTLGLPGRVAVLRLRKAKELQRSRKMGDEQVFQALLAPTLSLLFEAETALLDHEGVDSRGKSGLISFGSDQIGYAQEPPTSAELRFWEAYAGGRDWLWRQRRSRERPEVITLPSQWPRGLPIQHLISPEMQDELVVPFVVKRAEAVVFADPAVALEPAPTSRAARQAIGNFIDSYSTALRLWVRAVKDKKEQQSRILKAWSYALGPLTGGRMTPEEAEVFWHVRAFKAAEDHPHVAVNLQNSPRYPAPVPVSENPSTLSEWDPDPTCNVSVESPPRHLGPLTALDCTLRPGEEPLAEMGEPWTEIVRVPSFWGSCLGNTAWSKVRSNPLGKDVATEFIDPLIAAAVLTVDSVEGQGSILLRYPFPSSEHPRFPALYLEQDFLERESEHGLEAIRALRGLRGHVPTELLAQLARSVLTKTETIKEVEKRRYDKFVAIVKLIIESDNPSLSIPLIEEFIMEHHDASSYFRDLLGVRLMKKLRADDAARLFARLAEQIASRLSKASIKDEDERNASAPDVLPGPSVKITTVKMFAQLPREGRAINTQQSLEILANLFKQASHIDVRTAVLRSLRESPIDQQSRDFVNGFLEKWAVGVAGSLNERSPETEADWKSAENGGALPEVNEERSILQLLLEDDPLNGAIDFSLARNALVISGKSNVRWMRLFIRRHGASLPTLPDEAYELPSIPAWPQGLVHLLQVFHRAKHLSHTREPSYPPEILESMKRYVFHLLDPPQWLSDLTEHVKGNAELRGSNEGLHWLRIWDSKDVGLPRANWQLSGGNWACKTLNQCSGLDDSESPNIESTSCAALQKFVSEMADLCIAKGEVEALYSLVKKLKPHRGSDLGIVDISRGPGKVLYRIVHEVEALGGREWQRNPDRQPHRLPDVILLRIWLLCLSSSPSETQLRDFTARAKELMSTVVKDNVPYEARMQELRQQVDMQAVGQAKLEVANLLCDGILGPDPDMIALLRVQLAASLMKTTKQVKVWQGKAGSECRKAVKQWEQSLDAYVREQAYDMRKWAKDNLPYTDPTGEAWFA